MTGLNQGSALDPDAYNVSPVSVPRLNELNSSRLSKASKAACATVVLGCEVGENGFLTEPSTLRLVPFLLLSWNRLYLGKSGKEKAVCQPVATRSSVIWTALLGDMGGGQDMEEFRSFSLPAACQGR